MNTAPTQLVIDALREASETRTRAGLKAALAVERKRLGPPRADVRADAVRVVTFLAEAAQLSAEADRLEHLATLTPNQLVEEFERDRIRDALLNPGTAVDLPAGGTVLYEQAPDAIGPDDGLSAAAHHVAQLAGLEDAVVPGDAAEAAVEDELGTLPEDLDTGPEVDAGSLLDGSATLDRATDA